MQYEIIHRVRGVEWYVLDRRGLVSTRHSFACRERGERHTVAPNITHAREVRDAYVDFDTGGRREALKGRVIIRRYVPAETTVKK